MYLIITGIVRGTLFSLFLADKTSRNKLYTEVCWSSVISVRALNANTGTNQQSLIYHIQCKWALY